MEDFFWLNDDSRTFLSRGYIDGGKTAEERIRDIGEAAADILNDYDFADKFCTYMARGYYSLSSPVWSNFGTTKGLPCLLYTSPSPRDKRQSRMPSSA